VRTHDAVSASKPLSTRLLDADRWLVLDPRARSIELSWRDATAIAAPPLRREGETAIGVWILVGWIAVSLPVGLIIGHAMGLVSRGSRRKPTDPRLKISRQAFN
jgi:hypothetical protein